MDATNQTSMKCAAQEMRLCPDSVLAQLHVRKSIQDAVCKETASGKGSILTDSMWQPVNSLPQLQPDVTSGRPNLVTTCPANRATTSVDHRILWIFFNYSATVTLRQSALFSICGYHILRFAVVCCQTCWPQRQEFWFDSH